MIDNISIADADFEPARSRPCAQVGNTCSVAPTGSADTNGIISAVEAVHSAIVTGRSEVASSFDALLGISADSALDISRRLSVIEQQNAQILGYLSMLEQFPLTQRVPARRDHGSSSIAR